MIYIAFLIVTLIIVAFLFYEWQYFMVFAPVKYRDGPLCSQCTLLSVISDDGVELEGVVYEPEHFTNRLLVFVGRSHDAVGLINRLSKIYKNTQIITFNYRSYGESQGVANENNLLHDGVKIAKLVQKNYGNFYLLGFSIGSSVAAYVASKVEVKSLFLIGAFDSMDALAHKKFGIWLTPVLRYHFNTKLFMQNVTAPTYLFVSKADRLTYIDNARELKKSIKNLAYYVEFKDLAHQELLWDKRVIKVIQGVVL